MIRPAFLHHILPIQRLINNALRQSIFQQRMTFPATTQSFFDEPVFPSSSKQKFSLSMKVSCSTPKPATIPSSSSNVTSTSFPLNSQRCLGNIKKRINFKNFPGSNMLYTYLLFSPFLPFFLSYFHQV